MGTASQGLIVNLVRRVAPNIRFPRLFALFLILFIADVLIPDPVPFLDEIVLALGTILFGMWHQNRQAQSPPPQKPPEKNVTPRS